MYQDSDSLKQRSLDDDGEISLVDLFRPFEEENLQKWEEIKNEKQLSLFNSKTLKRIQKIHSIEDYINRFKKSYKKKLVEIKRKKLNNNSWLEKNLNFSVESENSLDIRNIV